MLDNSDPCFVPHFHSPQFCRRGVLRGATSRNNRPQLRITRGSAPAIRIGPQTPSRSCRRSECRSLSRFSTSGAPRRLVQKIGIAWELASATSRTVAVGLSGGTSEKE
jgi:hypothetical protein